MINLSNTTPAAPSGSLNIQWQQDGAGNVSANVPGFAGIAGVNAQVGTSYTVVASDSGKLVTLSNSAAVAVTLPVATSFPAQFFLYFTNLGAGTVTITPTTSTLDNAANIILLKGQGVLVFSDGNNYWTTGSLALGKAAIALTGQGANIAATTAFAVPATGAGMYKVFAYLIVTQAATTSSTLPSLTITWTDADNNTAQSFTLTATNAGNALTTFQQAVLVINAKASTNIQYSTSGYATLGATSMQYGVHIQVKAI
jgi:hypothetical protein